MSEERLPESKAAERLASAIGTHLSPQWLTKACLEDVCRKVVAHRAFFRGVFDELDADPRRLPDTNLGLRQQQVAEADSVTWWLEHTAHLKREYEDSAKILERVTAAEQRRKLRDHDEDAADEDDARVSRDRADEKAASGMPRIAS